MGPGPLQSEIERLVGFIGSSHSFKGIASKHHQADFLPMVVDHLRPSQQLVNACEGLAVSFGIRMEQHVLCAGDARHLQPVRNRVGTTRRDRRSGRRRTLEPRKPRLEGLHNLERCRVVGIECEAPASATRDAIASLSDRLSAPSATPIRLSVKVRLFVR